MTQRQFTVPASIVLTLLLLPAGRLPAEEAGEAPGEARAEVLSQSHRVPIGPERTLFVTEYHTRRAELRKPARAVIFLTGPDFRGSFWALPGAAYHAPAMAARRGFYSYTLDCVGVGESHRPDNGAAVNHLSNVAPLREVIDFVRRSRQVDRVDLVGEGYGGQIAAELADEPERVRSVVLTSIFYKSLNPAIAESFTPELEAFLRNQPNGYWEPDLAQRISQMIPPEARELREYALATQPGRYPTGPFLQFYDFDLPILDPAAARVPALILAGEHDPIPGPAGIADLAADWGGGAALVVVPGGGHAPRLETVEVASRFFKALFDFIDPATTSGS